MIFDGINKINWKLTRVCWSMLMNTKIVNHLSRYCAANLPLLESVACNMWQYCTGSSATLPSLIFINRKIHLIRAFIYKYLPNSFEDFIMKNSQVHAHECIFRNNEFTKILLLLETYQRLTCHIRDRHAWSETQLKPTWPNIYRISLHRNEQNE